jgi:hypothetical protein
MSNESGCHCGQAHGACATEFQYAVKLVSGAVDAQTPGSPAAPGQYWTAINIHNPDKCKKAHFRTKLAIANPLHVGPVSAFTPPYDLGPDEAFEIDRQHITLSWPLLFPGLTAPNFIKGYLVIESDIELDVVAVYTTAQTATGAVTNFYTERVSARCVPVCEDLVLPLHTGVAPWQTVSPAPLGPVVPISGFSGWTPAPTGASWVSQAVGDGTSATLITRSYELCFDLCSGFEMPAAFPIQVLVDDTAQVFLNGPQIGGTVPYNVPTTLLVTSQLLQQSLHAGRNCFRVNVTNGPPPAGGATGFALTGILRVVRGKCPCAQQPPSK